LVFEEKAGGLAFEDFVGCQGIQKLKGHPENKKHSLLLILVCGQSLSYNNEDLGL